MTQEVALATNKGLHFVVVKVRNGLVTNVAKRNETYFEDKHVRGVAEYCFGRRLALCLDDDDCVYLVDRQLKQVT